MKPAQIIKHYLSFSRGEQRGIIILGLIILLINLLRWFLPNVKQMNPVDFSAFSQEITRFEEALTQAKSSSGKRITGPSRSSFPASGKRDDSTKTNERYREPSFVIEVNSADTLDLQRLRGIGPSFARRITGYRKRLGGFVAVSQLLEVYGFDSSRFEGIRKYLTVDPSAIRQMNLNALSFKELMVHPYMPYELAKEIALYRKKQKGIRDIEEIRGMKSCDSATLVKLKPYLSFELPTTK
ncbi:MAG: helix-hairpin-helix domain-containing protein [Bacteroidales bacterium]|nr:helix-hairpin-helix domain-containing protein [Bacteroidales bacterium]